MSKMKIMIAYDGSTSAGAMLDDLKNAGLPREAEALVVSVGEVWTAPAPGYVMIETVQADIPFRIKEAEKLAVRASERLKKIFPRWKISAEAYVGSPSHEILSRAEEWQPDLITVGSQGHSAVGRFIFGSVSQKIVTEAHCSVRIARGRVLEDGDRIRIIIGLDGSPGSEIAADAVSKRSWPEGTEVLLVTSIGSFAAADAGFGKVRASDGFNFAGKNESYAHYMQPIQQAIETKLRDCGLKTSAAIRSGDPRQVLIDEAEGWGADAIFVGSRGFGRFKRFLLGSVSTAIVARAHCSVEVVR